MSFSYPALVLINFYYEKFIYINNSQYLAHYFKPCSGLLINRKSIITSASCETRSFLYSSTYFSEEDVVVNVTLNARFPTISSMYSIYVANYKKINLDYRYVFKTEPSRQLYLQEITTVNMASKLFFIIYKFNYFYQYF